MPIASYAAQAEALNLIDELKMLCTPEGRAVLQLLSAEFERMTTEAVTLRTDVQAEPTLPAALIEANRSIRDKKAQMIDLAIKAGLPPPDFGAQRV